MTAMPGSTVRGLKEMRERVGALESEAKDLSEQLAGLRDTQSHPERIRRTERERIDAALHETRRELEHCETHPPLIFKSKHAEKIASLQSDVKRLENELQSVAEQAAEQLKVIPGKIAEAEARAAHVASELATLRTELTRTEAEERREKERFYSEKLRPALERLVGHKANDRRIDFLDDLKQVSALMDSIPSLGLDKTTQGKGTVRNSV